MGGSRDELAPGVAITASLRLVRRLGGGGMGEVWIAHHRGLDVPVAVKFISDDGDAARFRTEAAAAARVRSPHVVQVLDYGHTENDTPYLVMELLEGHDLADHLAKVGKLPPREVLEIVGQVGKALDRAHQLGIVHRDVTPANVFLCRHDDDGPFVKLLDFGLAKRAHATSVTASGDAIGTLHYMSPEQVLDSKSIDHTTDLWSLGVLGFQMLTGTLPFSKGATAMVAMSILRDAIPLPAARNPALPPAVDDWFLRACSRDRSKRYETAKDLANALADALFRVVVREAIDAPQTIRDPPRDPETC